MINKKNIAVLFILFAFFTNSFAQTQAKVVSKKSSETSSKMQFFPVMSLKPGMRGKAWTVFQGSQPEEFDVEILGIVPGAIGPKQDMIVGKISGGSAERTSVFAGMSGSPVYIDGKLVGAISYSFPFSKEPICGITPIEQMISLFEQNQNALPKAQQPRPLSFSELASTEWKPEYPVSGNYSSSVLMTNPNSPLAAVAGQSFQPIAVPVTFSGFSPQTLKFFEKELLQVGLMPVSSVGGSAAITPLKKSDSETLLGGTSVSMQLTRGDYSMAASGTVTYRDGDRIYAFGHPFLNLGSSDLPMSESSVVTVIPNLNNSFKLAVPGAMVGSMLQDRNTGVMGKLGQTPKMIPVRVNLENSRNQKETLNFEIAKDDFLTPLLLNISIFNSISSKERGIGDSTIKLDGVIKIKGQNELIKIDRRFAGMQALQFAGASVAFPVSNVLQSRFENLEIENIELQIKTVDGSKTADLERIVLDKTQIRAGETVEIQAFVRTDSGRIFIQKIPVKIPADTPAGTLMVTVGDGNSVQQEAISRQFVPKDIAEMIRMINEIKKNDRLYVQINRLTNGAVIGAKELPNLPPSVLATLNNDRTAGGFKPTVQTVLTEQEVAPAEFLISGKQTLAIEVIK
ncbi:MAG: SpoIVB peptidase S55 domain-containing protein [Pyrinomonadaceae bacterium]